MMMDPEWAKLYDEHAPRVRAILYRMGVTNELDDLLQECFLKIWKGMKNFRGESSAKTWITRITMNTVYDHFRSKGVNVQFETVEEMDLAADEPVNADAPMSEIVRGALQDLSVSHREVIVLHVLEENSVSEIAAALGISEGTVKSRLHHARENLKRILTKRGVRHDG